MAEKYSQAIPDPLTPAMGGTGVVNSKNLTVSNALTLAGTDSTTMTFPSTSATVARTDAAQTFTSPFTVNGANGALEIECATDGGDLNIFSSNGTQVLAFYGSGGNILNINLLDGYLALGGTTRITNAGVFFPVQAATVSAPSYVKGGIYFDTTLNKLRIGGAAAWETVTSA